jgi:hypothetical protein
MVIKSTLVHFGWRYGKGDDQYDNESIGSTRTAVNRTPAIRNLPLRVTPIFANKNHALNALKMGPFLRINVMLPQGVSG